MSTDTTQDSQTVTAVVAAAARAAASLVPARTQLVTGTPASDPDGVPLPGCGAGGRCRPLGRGHR